jgi:hypothetical protein
LGSIIRVVLAVLNVIFLLIGLFILFVGLVLKFSTFLDPYLKQLKTLGLPDSVFSYLDYVYIGLIVIGAVIFVINAIGLIGVCSGIRFFLILYDIVILVIFLVHVGAFIYIIVATPQIQTILKGALSSMLAPLISQLNSTSSYNLSQSDLNTYCQPYTMLSGFLKCCDFTTNVNLTTACCPTSYSGGCVDTFYSLMTTYVVYIVNLPNGVLVACELAIFISVVFVIIKKWQYRNKENGGGGGPPKKNQVAPTTEPDYIM